MEAKSFSSAIPLEAWKPGDTCIEWHGPVLHDPKESNLMVALMSVTDSSIHRPSTLKTFFIGPSEKDWENEDSLQSYVSKLILEKKKLQEQLFFIDLYYTWPNYDDGLKGFPLHLYQEDACVYFHNFRGIISDKIFLDDFGRFLEVSGMPTDYLFLVKKEKVPDWLKKKDTQGRILVRIYFRYQGRIQKPCLPEKPLSTYNQIQILGYAYFPTPKKWGEKPN